MRARVLYFAAGNGRSYASSRRAKQPRGGRAAKEALYEDSLEFGLSCPTRLRGRDNSTIELARDWYLPMLNDSQRSEFFWEILGRRVQGKVVVDVGAGCGLLSLMAAKLGAKLVVGIESNWDLAELAILNRESNGFTWDTVRFVHGNSRGVQLPDEEKADIIVSETLGTLMLGEGMLDIVADARRRLAHKHACVVPSHGAQYATLVSSPTLDMLSRVQPSAYGLRHAAINCLMDTGKIMTTKGRGIRLSSLPDLVQMSPRVCVLQVDFGSMECASIPHTLTHEVEAMHDGIIHAVVMSWEVWDGSDPNHRITTHYEDTKDVPWGCARDLHWGQGLQLVEDGAAGATRNARYTMPVPFVVKAGERLQLSFVFSEPDRRMMQCHVQRCPS